MSQAELLRLVVTVLRELEIEHMLVGSHASSFFGEPRSTHDIDLVVDLPTAKIQQLVASFDPARYYFSEVALREGRMANLIDTQSGDKVDCFILGPHPFDQLAFSRRRLENIMGVEVPLASAEDTILAKLKWNKMMGGSTRQQADVLEIFRYQRDALDVDYLTEHSATLGLQAELNEYSMLPEKLENQIAMETQAGRDGLAVWRRVIKNMTGAQKVAKAFELTELTRRTMRAGIRRQFPHASEAEIHELYVDRLLQCQGTSLAKVRQQITLHSH